MQDEPPALPSFALVFCKVTVRRSDEQVAAFDDLRLGKGRRVSGHKFQEWEEEEQQLTFSPALSSSADMHNSKNC